MWVNGKAGNAIRPTWVEYFLEATESGVIVNIFNNR